MKRKTLTIFSIVSIIIISLILLGITYGYFTTTITGNKSDKSIEVVTGDSKVLYNDITTNNATEPVEPGYKTVKTFTVKNIGTAPAKYSIYLVDVLNNFERKSDITYNLYKKVGTITDVTIDTNLSDWTRVNTTENTVFPSEMAVIAPNEEIETPNQIYTYVLKVEYIDHPTENQNIDQGKTLSFKVNLRAEATYTNPYSEGTLAYHILDNGAQVLNASTNELEIDKTYEEKTQITKVSDGTDMSDVGIFTAPDDYGTSYYYRGPVKNNYVNFAGFMWRIVRINGDGSIRLILDGTLDMVKREGLDVYAGSLSAFNESYGDNAYVGYMYGLTGASENNCVVEIDGVKSIDSTIETESACTNGKWLSGYDITHMNLNDSTIKAEVDKFYEIYIESNTNNYHYEDYLADTLFCSDKTIYDGLGYGMEYTEYGAYDRLPFEGSLNPTLECAKGASNTYSRFTSNLETTTKTSKDVNINNDLKHPIAVLSADELVMAGAARDSNEAYYLYDANKNGTGNNFWWAMSPSHFYDSGEAAGEFGSYVSYYSLGGDFVNGTYSVRPVINLRADLLIQSGNGTSGSGAYTVKLPN